MNIHQPIVMQLSKNALTVLEKRYLRKDMVSFEKTLAQVPKDAGKLVVVDGVFSVEGDLAPLSASQRYDRYADYQAPRIKGTFALHQLRRDRERVEHRAHDRDCPEGQQQGTDRQEEQFVLDGKSHFLSLSRGEPGQSVVQAGIGPSRLDSYFRGTFRCMAIFPSPKCKASLTLARFRQAARTTPTAVP